MVGNNQIGSADPQTPFSQNLSQPTNSNTNDSLQSSSINGYVSPYAGEVTNVESDIAQQSFPSDQIPTPSISVPESMPVPFQGTPDQISAINQDYVGTPVQSPFTPYTSPVSPQQEVESIQPQISTTTVEMEEHPLIELQQVISSQQPEQSADSMTGMSNNIEVKPSSQEFNPEKDLQATVTVNIEEIDIKKLLDLVIEKDASDLHLTSGYPAQLRIDGQLVPIGTALTPELVGKLISQTLNQNQKELLEVNKEVDLSYQHGEKARFRVNAYNERGNLAAAYRLIPQKIRTIEQLRLPSVLYNFTHIAQGLFLVTGPTGSGKSTTLAAMIQEINERYASHIITIEDPIEYVYAKQRALVDQRELGVDTHDWNIALRSILRQDPDVVLIGEMRDFETIQAALTIAETGHLVFATLHTNSAAQSIDRIIDVFPPHQQAQVRTQLAGSLKGILSQRLIPLVNSGRQAAIELLVVTPAVQNLVREGKTYQIDNVISTSQDIGMISLEKSLVKMIREGKITVETAQEYAIRPDDILKLMKTGF